MVYYADSDILIRDMEERDAEIFPVGERAQGWLDSSADKFEMRLAHVREGKCVSLVAEYRENAAGYVNVYPDCQWGALGGQGLCEIVDFAVLEKYRRLGVGSRLMDVAERIAFTYADKVYLGVGLHCGYGPAQRMYVRRGYIPDGSGVWYGSKVCEPYADCKNDDDLNIYLMKYRDEDK